MRVCSVPRTKELIKFAVNAMEYVRNNFLRQLKYFRQPWNFYFSKKKLNNKLSFIKYLQVKLVILMVRANLPRLTVIIKKNKL